MAASPIPPARASGDIRKKGTAVETILIESAWAIIAVGIAAAKPKLKNAKAHKFLRAFFIQNQLNRETKFKRRNYAIQSF